MGEVAISYGIEWEQESGFSLHSVFSWYPADPFAVYMNFHDSNGHVEWVVARSLFTEAVYKGQSGDGDCQMVVSLKDDVLVMFLQSQFGEIGMKAKVHQLTRFLEETFKNIPEGDEDISEDIDIAISAILEEEDQP